jgi:hypothetical protein
MCATSFERLRNLSGPSPAAVISCTTAALSSCGPRRTCGQYPTGSHRHHGGRALPAAGVASAWAAVPLERQRNSRSLSARVARNEPHVRGALSQVHQNRFHKDRFRCGGTRARAKRVQGGPNVAACSSFSAASATCRLTPASRRGLTSPIRSEPQRGRPRQAQCGRRFPSCIDLTANARLIELIANPRADVVSAARESPHSTKGCLYHYCGPIWLLAKLAAIEVETAAVSSVASCR